MANPRWRSGLSDLNLLVALEALLTEESVSGAARRLGMSQPALSRSLAKLRASLDDELLVRTPGGMRPTRRGSELLLQVRRILRGIESLTHGLGKFEASRERHTFCVAAVDHAQAVLLAPLARRFAREAPRIDLIIRPMSAASERELASGALHLYIAPRLPMGQGTIWTPLREETYSSLVWREHPSANMDLRAFVEAEHVLVAPWGGAGGVVDAALAAKGARRRVAVQIPTFLVLPHMLVGTNRVATVPRSIAELLVTTHPLRIVTTPVPIPGFTLCQAWHEIHRQDTAHQWLRRAVLEEARAPHPTAATTTPPLP